MAKYKIAIIGAGPAGCTLARLLLHKNVDVDVAIFEGEKGLNGRTQGGTLDLHTESGIKAMKECGLYEDFLKMARFDAEAFRMCNKYMQTFLRLGGTKDAKNMRGRPEIDRIQLRQLLLDALPDGIIRWDHHLQTIDETEGNYHLHFRDRPSETGFDLIVGADGCWSHVRSLLTNDKPYYAGVSGIGFQISDPKEKHPELYELVDRGSLFAYSDNRGITGQQLGSGFMHLSYWRVQSEEWINQFEGKTSDVEVAKQVVLKEIEDWDPKLRHLVECADGNFTPRNLYMLPVGNTWTNRPGVTLLGDAAHVMTPFAGEGVNLAMVDAMKLTESIERATTTGTKDALTVEIKLYEQDMFKRAKIVQKQTYDMMTATLLDEGSLDKNIEKYIITAATVEVPAIFKPIFWLFARIYFAVWRWRNPSPKKAV